MNPNVYQCINVSPFPFGYPPRFVQISLQEGFCPRTPKFYPPRVRLCVAVTCQQVATGLSELCMILKHPAVTFLQQPKISHLHI